MTCINIGALGTPHRVNMLNIFVTFCHGHQDFSEFCNSFEFVSIFPSSLGIEVYVSSRITSSYGVYAISQ